MKPDLDELMAADLGALIDWLLTAKAQVNLFDPQEWLGLVELFTMRIMDAPNNLTPAEWTRLSDAYYKSLEYAEMAHVLDQQASAVRSLNLSSALMQNIVPNYQVALLSPDFAIETFVRVVPVSLSEAQRLVDDWRSSDVDAMRRSRVAKNMLTPLVSMKPYLNEQGLRVVAEWEPLLHRLP